jgi:formylglycine-generating enzyme required for sulfatase activity
MMKRLLPLFLCVASFLCAGSNGFALTIPASEDSVGYNNQISASGNAAVQLAVDVNHKAFIYFNLNDIPTNAVVRWAKLRMFLPTVTAKGSGLSIYQVGGVWNECKPSVMPFIQPYAVASISADQLGNKRFVTVDVTATVQNWISMKAPNEGFAIAPTLGYYGTSSLTLTSKEGPSLGIPAELDIDFQPETTQLTVDQLPASLKALMSPSFVSQPVLGYSGSLSAVAQGFGLLNYQWFKDGVAVAGGTTASLSLSGLSSGNYTLRVSNGNSATYSAPVAFDAANYLQGFSLISAGSFQMGDSLDHTANAPLQVVNVSAYQMGKTHVTFSEWKTVKAWAESHGYGFDNLGAASVSTNPVANINWYDAIKWCNAKSEMEGLTPYYYTDMDLWPAHVYRIGQFDATNVTVNWFATGYRLPTEAEWEKAARGGLSGKRFPNGDVLSNSDANFGSVLGEKLPVKSYPANGFGLYDMAGNAWAWCWDAFGSYAGSSLDPKGGEYSGSRIIRGGAFDSTAADCRVFNRGQCDPHSNTASVSFRAARRTVPVGSPTIVTQPSYSPAGFSLLASGSGNLTYQWYRDGTPIAGGTSALLPASFLVTGGRYNAKVSNSVGSALSGYIIAAEFMATPLASNFSLITAGSFQMGDNLDNMYDAPVHMVSVGSFSIAKTELNYGDWKAVKSWAENHGYQFNNTGSGRGDNYPVNNINWYDAVKWCNARSEMEGLTPFYYLDASFTSSSVYRSGQVDISGSTINRSATGYRLPTEAEWEKAARGGLVGKRYPNGDTLANTDANFDNHSDGTNPSKSYPANGFGLYDMTGNSWEWVSDWYADTYDLSTISDPQGPDSRNFKVARGGGWNRNFHLEGDLTLLNSNVPLKSYIKNSHLTGYSTPGEAYQGAQDSKGNWWRNYYDLDAGGYIYDTRVRGINLFFDSLSWFVGADIGLEAADGAVDFGPDLSSLTVAGRSCFSPGYSDMNSGVRLVRSALPAGSPSAGLPVVTGTALTVNAQGATPLSYQWFYNGAPVVSGTSATLSTTGLSGGTYSVRVSNSVGTSTSADYIFP